MTEKLYYNDAYTKEFTGKILSIEKDDSGIFSIVLDRTAFFPESGGQSGDTGVLAGGKVLDTLIENEVISHRVQFSENIHIPNVGDEVDGFIDWDFRFDKMQQHTGEHIFSGMVKKHFGYENIGFHLSGNTVSMDYNGPLSDKDIEALETETNVAIFKNLPVRAYFPDPSELSSIDYRAKLDASEMGQVRIVDIQDTDICACCAPHVSSTAEVGMLKVISSTNYKGGIRLFILCGMRALLDYRNGMNVLSAMSQKMSLPSAELPMALDKIYINIEEKEQKIQALNREILSKEISGLPKNGPAIIFTKTEDNILLRNLANDLQKNRSEVFIFYGIEGEYKFIIASTDKNPTDIIKSLGNTIEIKGGGKPPMVQGTCKASRDAIEKAISTL